jgi:hypothetical protein
MKVKKKKKPRIEGVLEKNERLQLRKALFDKEFLDEAWRLEKQRNQKGYVV